MSSLSFKRQSSIAVVVLLSITMLGKAQAQESNLTQEGDFEPFNPRKTIYGEEIEDFVPKNNPSTFFQETLELIKEMFETSQDLLDDLERQKPKAFKSLWDASNPSQLNIDLLLGEDEPSSPSFSTLEEDEEDRLSDDIEDLRKAQEF